MSRPLAVTGATVVPMDAPRVLPQHTVVVEDGVIRTVASATAVDTSGMDVVDGSRRWLVPGLADMHVHFWDPGEATLFLAHGVTTVRNMWGAPFHLAWAKKVARREIPGPRVVTTSPIVDGVGPTGVPIWPGSTALTDASRAQELVERYAERGYSQIKGYSLLRPDALSALGQAARRAGVRLGGHCPNAVTFEDAIASGQTCFEHLTAIANGHLRDGASVPFGTDRAGAARISAEALDLEAIRRLARRMAAEDVWNCPTSTVWFGMAEPSISDALARPRMRYVPAGTRASWDARNDFRFRNMDRPAYVDAAARWNERLLECLTVLHAEGAPIIAGTDTPNPFVVQGFALHDELANLVRCGMTPFEAISCATVNAARFLGESGTWSTIAPGMRADLVLVRADPLRDVGALREIDAVVANGFHLSRADLDAMLTQRASACEDAPAREPDAADLGADPPGTTMRGVLRDEVAGVMEGCCAFRHVRLADGGLDIEEVFAAAAWPPRRTVVRLAPDLTVRHARVTSTGAGAEELTVDVTRTQTGYRVRRVDEDGWAEETNLETPACVPSEMLAVTALALLDEDVSVPALDPSGSAATLTVKATGEERTVLVRRAGGNARIVVRLDESGSIVSLEQQLWRGPRRLTARGSQA